jgi:hypothetical protein
MIGISTYSSSINGSEVDLQYGLIHFMKSNTTWGHEPSRLNCDQRRAFERFLNRLLIYATEKLQFDFKHCKENLQGFEKSDIIFEAPI